MFLCIIWLFIFQGPMEVGESVSSSLRRILTKKVLVAVKPAIGDEIGNLGQRVDAIIENATEVSLNTCT